MVEASVGQLVFRAADDDHAGIWSAIRTDDRDTRRTKIVDGVALRQEIAGNPRKAPAHIGGSRHRRGNEQLLGDEQIHGA